MSAPVDRGAAWELQLVVTAQHHQSLLPGVAAQGKDEIQNFKDGFNCTPINLKTLNSPVRDICLFLQLAEPGTVDTPGKHSLNKTMTDPLLKNK